MTIKITSKTGAVALSCADCGEEITEQNYKTDLYKYVRKHNKETGHTNFHTITLGFMDVTA